MRVLLTTDTVGGVWTFTRELAAGLLTRGHTVAMISLGRAPSWGQSTWVKQVQKQHGADFTFEASEVPLEWMENNSQSYEDAAPRLLRLITKFQPDLLHTSQFCFGALPVNLPRIVTAHSDVLSWAEACRPDGLGESKWLTTYRALVCAGLAGAEAVIVPTRWMGDALARHFPVPCGFHVVPNGRTLPAADAPARSVQAVTIGRLWDEAKGLAILRGLEPCMPLLVVGEAQFENGQAPQLNAATFLGNLDEQDLLDVLRSSSLYLATSLYEPFGLAPLEAALCGCGVLARDIPSLREVWGDAAMYFSDQDSLSTLLLQLKASPSELSALQQRSLQRALQLSAARMVEGYVAHYENLLATRNANQHVVAYA